MASWYSTKEGGKEQLPMPALIITIVVILLGIGVIGYVNYF